jgi:hypothetical protein
MPFRPCASITGKRMTKKLVIGALVFVAAVLFVTAIRPARPDYVDARGLFCHYSAAVRDYLCWPRNYK